VPGFHQLVGGSVPIDHLLQDGQILELSPQLHLRVIHSPGHSPGSTSFYLQEEGIVIAGDAVPVPGDMPVYDDPLVSLESVKRLKALEIINAQVSSWDDAHVGQDARAALDRAIELIERIHSAVRVVANQIEPTDPLAFCRKVLGALQLPETLANPLVARTFLGHYKLRDRETLRE
jgi:hypothetical protein